MNEIKRSLIRGNQVQKKKFTITIIAIFSILNSYVVIDTVCVTLFIEVVTEEDKQ